MEGEGIGDPEVDEEARTRGGEGGQVWTHWLVTWREGNEPGIDYSIFTCEELPKIPPRESGLAWPACEYTRTIFTGWVALTTST